MLEAMEAAQKSTSKLRKLQQGVDCLQSGSEVGSMTGGYQSGLRQEQRLPSNLGRIQVAAEESLGKVG